MCENEDKNENPGPGQYSQGEQQFRSSQYSASHSAFKDKIAKSIFFDLAIKRGPGPAFYKISSKLHRMHSNERFNFNPKNHWL